MEGCVVSEQYSTDAGSLLNNEQDVFSAGAWEQEGGEEDRYGCRLLKKKMARSVAGVAGWLAGLNSVTGAGDSSGEGSGSRPGLDVIREASRAL
ncbi:unnamed protein product [Clonostachys rosea]|uniref:Uncharacterized protein n=1 Tax=Bionectria ochroleuca TaxID=29856 RepID=A0ABY6V2E6_BIOOC|nr:unnamed protein product [Clonostachys rosea]